MPAEAPASSHPIISVERFNYAYGDHQVLLSREGLDAKGIEASIRSKMGLPIALKAAS